MKKLTSLLMAAAVMLSLGACSNSGNSGAQKAKNKAQATAKVKDEGHPSSLNIRFVDGDSIGANYNFAKDIQDAIVRAQSRQESAEKTKSTELDNYGKKIQALASEIDTKMRNNTYLSEVSMNADQKKYEQMMQNAQKMQSSAQSYLADMARSSQNEIMQLQLQLQDSIDSFIRAYNAEKGYDAILYKAAGVYFNPTLDITDEVIEGLNARYNKVK